MKTSIRWRLVLMYVLLVVIVMMVSGSMIVLRIMNNEMESLTIELKDTAEKIQDYIGEYITLDVEVALLEKQLEEYYNSTAGLYTNKRVFLLDGDLNAGQGRVILPRKDADQGTQFTTHQVAKAYTDGDDSIIEIDKNVYLEDDDANYIGYAENIKIGDKVVFIIYVLGDTASVNQAVTDTVKALLFAIAVALVIAVFLGFIFAEFLTKPIAALTLKARDMSRGHLDSPTKVYGNDEIGQLTKTFNKMAVSLSQTMNEIKGEKNKLETVFKHMTDGILVFDKMGVMIHSNPASVQMLKLTKQISFQEVFKPYLDVTYTEMKGMVMEDTISHILMVENKYYSVYFAKFLDQYNEPLGLICVIQDVTEHKKLEEMQKDFVANVSHELRTPLTTIKSYAETLLEGVDDVEMNRKFLEVINHEGDRMTALVQDLLELSKLDNSQVQFSMNTLNLEHILSDSIDKFRIHAQKKRQSLIYYPPNFDCKILGDAYRVEQVIKNIISNAVKYSPEEALIEVGIIRTGKYLKVSIRDTGFGISPEDQKRIFERFYRVDKARSREMGGTGLGLAIAKEIMEYHGGKIEVHSILGEGTTFDLFFIPYESDF